MLEVQTKAKRQIEILGLAINNSTGLKDTDFAVMFNRDIPTIKRDMQELRSLGIDVHSERAKGICLTGRLEPRILREMILQYLGICNSASGVDKATALLVKQLKEKALSQLVMLQRCIDSSTIAVIDYQKDDVEIERGQGNSATPDIQQRTVLAGPGCQRGKDQAVYPEQDHRRPTHDQAFQESAAGTDRRDVRTFIQELDRHRCVQGENPALEGMGRPAETAENDGDRSRYRK